MFFKGGSVQGGEVLGNLKEAWGLLEKTREYLRLFGYVSPSCNLLRPLIKISFLLVPYGYIIIKKNS